MNRSSLMALSLVLGAVFFVLILRWGSHSLWELIPVRLTAPAQPEPLFSDEACDPMPLPAEADVEDRLESSLSTLRSTARAARWFDAIYEAEALLLDPRTRPASLARLSEIAHTRSEPEFTRHLAILIIGSAAPDVAPKLLWDLIVPQEGRAAIAAARALLINEYAYSLPDLWRELLTGRFSEFLFDGQVIEAIRAMENEEGWYGRTWERFGPVAALNSLRRPYDHPGSGSDLGPVSSDIFLPVEVLQDRLVELLLAWPDCPASKELWSTLNGANCARLGEFIILGDTSDRSFENAYHSFWDYEFLMENFPRIASHEVKMWVLTRFSYFCCHNSQQAADFIKSAFSSVHIPPEWATRIARGAASMRNEALMPFLAERALRSQDVKLKQALIGGLTESPSWGTGYVDTMRILMRDGDPGTRIKALSALSGYSDPDSLTILDQAARGDVSEEVRQAARRLADSRRTRKDESGPSP